MDKYKHIALEIQKYIIKNNLEQDFKLPKIEDLVHQYGVSKATIIKALEILEIRGIIYQRRGSGIFVRRPQKKNYFNLTDSFGFKNNNSNIKIETTVLGFDLIKSNSNISKPLQIEIGQDVYFIQRLQFIDNHPICIENSYYVKNLLPPLSLEVAQKSLFEYISNHSDISIGFADHYLQIDYLDTNKAKLLDLETSSPCLRFEETYYLQNGVPFNYSNNYYSHKYGKFSIPSSHFTTM